MNEPAGADSELKSKVRGIDRYTRANASDELPAQHYRGLEILGLSPALHEKVAAFAVSGLTPGSRILDLGCGSGALCLRLADAGFAVTGCDALAESFKLHGQIPFVATDLNTDFAKAFPAKFDAISATELIEHVENPRHFLRQCRALLNDGGKIFLTTPNIDSAMAKAYYVRTGNFWMFSDGDYEGVGHVTPISKWLLLKSLQEAGFSVRTLESIGDWGSFSDWWRMRLVASIFRKMAINPEEEGQILAVAAELHPRAL
jgi:2-polyprenyl-3-methyl-5-hydroxy-6-metoxy-1,4-benzoquinol methylase